MKIYIARVGDDFNSMVTAFASKREMEKHLDEVLDAEEIDTFVTHVQPRKKDVIAWFNTHAWHRQ